MAPMISEDLTQRGARYLISEARGYRSRDQVIIATGAGKLPSGMVLGKVTASGKYVPYAPAAADGSQNACAVLYQACDATSADVRRTITSRDAEVTVGELAWGAGVTTDAHKNTALAALAALGIIGR